MTLSAGSKLGPYEILSPLGAGGMGEVYRARDAKLNRDVAIKVLPEAVAEDAERLARFQREAQVLASLNHPHIAAIYGLEKAGNVEALVWSSSKGETLAERIAAGPIPDRRSPRDRAADRGRARGGAREGDRAPGPQARQREGHAGRQGQGAGLRPGEGADGGPVVAGPDALADPDGRVDAGGGRDRDGGVHVAGAGARQVGRQAGRHLGLRRRAVRDARRAQGVRGRDGLGHARRRAEDGSGLERAAGARRRPRSGACCGAASTATRSTRLRDVADARIEMDEAAEPAAASAAPASVAGPRGSRVAWAVAALLRWPGPPAGGGFCRRRSPRPRPVPPSRWRSRRAISSPTTTRRFSPSRATAGGSCMPPSGPALGHSSFERWARSRLVRSKAAPARAAPSSRPTASGSVSLPKGAS